jgi:hypothetical protein
MGGKFASGVIPLGIPMEKPYIYEIRVEGHLTDRWSDWFDGLAIRNETNGETTIAGLISDQAALLGVLSKIQALNLTLVSVNRTPTEKFNKNEVLSESKIS